MWRYSRNLGALYETSALAATAAINKARAEQIIERARKADRTLLTEAESKELLAAYGIPSVETKIAKSEKEAVDLTKKTGGAVVLKVYSETITHKSDVDGVKLNLRGATAVRRAYRAIEKSVKERVGAEAFLGVTVQSMVSNGGYELILGVGRLIKEHGVDEAEFAILISDPWQGKGLGTELLKLLVQIGRKERLRRIIGRISAENPTMKQVSEEVGFNLRFDKNEGEWKAELVL